MMTFRTRTRLAWLLLLSATSGVPAAAQQISGTIRGVVVATDTRNPLGGVLIEIEPSGRRARTDALGRFSIGGLAVGSHVVVIRTLGRVAQRQVVELSADGITVLDVLLDAAAVRLPAIEVLRERTELGYNIDDIAGSVHVISGDALDRQNPFHDVHQILRKVPGVNVQEEEGFGLRPNIGLRGTGSERSAKVTLMEDGILIAPAPYAAPSAYYFPVTGRMEAVEVRKGSSQIKYGPRTIGGAINLISTPIPDKFRVAADIAGGPNTTKRLELTVGDAYENFGWLAQSYRMDTNGFKQVVEGSSGFDLQDYNLRFRLNSNPWSSTYQALEVKIGYNQQRADETYLGLTDSDFRRQPNLRYAASQKDVLNLDHKQLHIRHFLRLSDRLDVTTTLYRNEFNRNWFKLQSVEGQSIARVVEHPEDYPTAFAILQGGTSSPDALRVRANKRAYFGQGVETILGVSFGSDITHEMEFGVRFHRDGEDRFQHEDAFQMLSNRMILSSAGAPGSQSNRVSEARAVSLFVQDDIVVGAITFTPGIRMESIRFVRTDYATDDPERIGATRVRENGVQAVIPGFGIGYQASSRLRVFGGVHRGFGPPGPGADEATDAEGSTNYEVGARFGGDDLNAQLVGFRNDYGNILGAATLATGGTGTGEQFNGGAVAIRGIELSFDYTPIASGGRALTFPVNLAFTYTTARFRTDFQSDYESWGDVKRNDELPYLPRVQLHASGGVNHARWSLNLGVNYSAAMRTVAGQGHLRTDQMTDAFAAIDLSGSYRVAPWTEIYLSVRNLTDESYIVARRPAGVRPGLPRTILGGVRIRR